MNNGNIIDNYSEEEEEEFERKLKKMQLKVG